MRFPYVPISYTIADVKAEMKKLDQSGAITDEDCRNAIIECMREIGGANYDTEPAVINICNNVGILPERFYTVNKIYTLDVSGGTPVKKLGGIWFTEENICYPVGSILYPGDAMTATRYSSSGLCCPTNPDIPTYIIKGNQVRCGIKTAKLGLIYNCLPYDPDFGYMIQDEVFTLKACKAYTIRTLLKEEFYAGRVAQYVWADINREVEQNIDQAQAIFKFDDPADDQARGKIQDHRYDQFRLR